MLYSQLCGHKLRSPAKQTTQIDRQNRQTDGHRDLNIEGPRVWCSEKQSYLIIYLHQHSAKQS